MKTYNKFTDKAGNTLTTCDKVQEYNDAREERFQSAQAALIAKAADYEVGSLTNDDGTSYGTIYSSKLPKECLLALQWRQSTRTNSQNLWDQFRIED